MRPCPNPSCERCNVPPRSAHPLHENAIVGRAAPAGGVTLRETLGYLAQDGRLTSFQGATPSATPSVARDDGRPAAGSPRTAEALFARRVVSASEGGLPSPQKESKVRASFCCRALCITLLVVALIGIPVWLLGPRAAPSSSPAALSVVLVTVRAVSRPRSPLPTGHPMAMAPHGHLNSLPPPSRSPCPSPASRPPSRPPCAATRLRQ